MWWQSESRLPAWNTSCYVTRRQNRLGNIRHHLRVVFGQTVTQLITVLIIEFWTIAWQTWPISGNCEITCLITKLQRIIKSQHRHPKHEWKKGQYSSRNLKLSNVWFNRPVVVNCRRVSVAVSNWWRENILVKARSGVSYEPLNNRFHWTPFSKSPDPNTRQAPRATLPEHESEYFHIALLRSEWWG